MTTAVEIVPKEVSIRLLTFLREAKTGNFTFHIKDGQVVGWEVKETGRLDIRK